MTDDYEVRDVIDKETLSTVKSVGALISMGSHRYRNGVCPVRLKRRYC